MGRLHLGCSDVPKISSDLLVIVMMVVSERDLLCGYWLHFDPLGTSIICDTEFWVATGFCYRIWGLDHGWRDVVWLLPFELVNLVGRRLLVRANLNMCLSG
eukprot:gene9828-biopygen2889